VIALADALYWIVASLVVLGGFVVFVCTVVKHLWDEAVKRKTRPVGDVYNFNTQIDVYNVFLGPAATPSESRQLIADLRAAPPYELEEHLEDDRVKQLVTLLLTSEVSDLPRTPQLAAAFPRWVLVEAMQLCSEATHSDLKTPLKERCAAASELLAAALAIDGEP